MAKPTEDVMRLSAWHFAKMANFWQDLSVKGNSYHWMRGHVSCLGWMLSENWYVK